ncbi:MAG: type II secretion system protein [Clostridia bacterium]|nr:type II secretion system protein [Clostridia bacterium]
MKRKNKGGFSLVEVVIALAIIVMVMGAGLSITLSSITTKVKAINRTHAQNFAENVLECFKEADTTTEFKNFLSILDTDGDAHSEIKDETEYFICTHESGGYQFTAYIAVTYKAGNRPLLEINVWGENNEEKIIEFSYEKGAIVAPAGEGGGI